ncbi:MAG: D-alanine-D-alanine ligase [Parcubacteria group bacterium Gr01-1014_46]|nr:MAG: D-alanine-D-alanine ligase [Parcubacteria group bacterium Gr01-1014_46]
MQTLPDSLRIGVIRGGPSNEYEVSLLGGAHVLELLSETHRPIDIFISKDGSWHMHGVEKSPEKILKNVDVVWNALHGQYGEDGKLQELLAHHGVKHNGSGKYSSALAMNKWLTKEHLKNFGIKTPTYALVRQTDDLKAKSKEIFNSIPGPLVVKPTQGGSSLGIKIVNTYVDFYNALYEVLSLQSDALVEEFIVGKEATVGVIENFRNSKTYSLPPVEIRYKGENSNKEKDTDFWDYNSKYNGESQEICPGNFTAKEKREMEALATLVHDHLGLRHYSRSDFIVSPKRGVYFLEVNTLPGMAKNSLFPLALKSVGSSVKDFLHHVLLLSLNSR